MVLRSFSFGLKTIKLGLFTFPLLVAGCNNSHKIKNTEWLTTKFVIDSPNYLSEIEKKVYLNFNSSRRLHVKFSDSLLFAFVERLPVDTSIFKQIKDTLFVIHEEKYRDTSIILKLTKDSLIEQRLAGVKIYSVRYRK